MSQFSEQSFLIVVRKEKKFKEKQNKTSGRRLADVAFKKGSSGGSITSVRQPFVKARSLSRSIAVGITTTTAAAAAAAVDISNARLYEER